MTARKQPRIAYGFWRYARGEADAAMRMIETARAAGVDHFDTADVYGAGAFGGAEALLGDIRKRAPSLLSGAEIATKAGVEIGTPYNSSRDYIAAAAEASLRRLGVEAVDLFYIHRPDLFAHPEEVAGALDALIASGKAKAVGVSNYSPAQLAALRRFLKAPLAAHQIEFSALHMEPLFDGVCDQAMAEGVDLFAWSPLAGGRLFAEGDARAARVRAALEDCARERDASLEATALAFLLSGPAHPTPIVGTKNSERFKMCVKALNLKLDRRSWYAILQASQGARLP